MKTSLLRSSRDDLTQTAFVAPGVGMKRFSESLQVRKCWTELDPKTMSVDDRLSWHLDFAITGTWCTGHAPSYWFLWTVWIPATAPSRSLWWPRWEPSPCSLQHFALCSECSRRTLFCARCMKSWFGSKAVPCARSFCLQIRPQSQLQITRCRTYFGPWPNCSRFRGGSPRSEWSAHTALALDPQCFLSC